MSKRSPFEDRLKGLPRPEPSAGLRSRIMTSTKTAPPPAVTLTDRLWVSPWLRLSWAAMAALVIWNLIGPDLGLLLRGGGAPQADPAVTEELVREADLPRSLAEQAARREAGTSDAGWGEPGAALWSIGAQRIPMEE